MTLVGERRRVDAVLPSREPVGALMPDILDLLGDQVRQPAQLRHLVTASGEVLLGDATLAEHGVRDGAVLRLVRSDEPLPAPVVHEVPDAVDGALDAHALRWSPHAARWTAIISFALAVLFAGIVLNSSHGGVLVDFGTLAVGVAALIGGLGVGLFRKAPLGTALSLGGGALLAVGAWETAVDRGWPDWSRAAGLVLVIGLTLVALCWSSPLGRGGVIGGAVVLFLGVVGTVCEATGLAPAQTGAVLAIVCAVLLSTMLRGALALSGLTTLDDQRTGGAPVPRADVLTALAAAHRSLLIATLAVAVAAGAAGAMVIGAFDAWSAATGTLLAVIVASRARVFPLVPQKGALWLAAIVAYAAVALGWSRQVSWGVFAGTGMLLLPAVLPVVVLTVTPPEHVRARLRRITNRVEAAAMITLVPVALGTFGVFTRLLHTF
ncbi:type VII secretion integral membrane protein EccD [Actinomadura rupiterrae]|uniref:type VII secretion integral membrane protein EccD n=1 Tax=Actinomadura rupiterrae TaxID=559627 RepID=UPI0020A2C6F0|nr:type VII secretion integral membrane protein EccD [Actinomadura rupiterrae]MCP2337572.1 type VII secretion integral membrane protein EccD [Actinomadura rupiterrae]